MRGQHRHGLASVRHRLALGALDLVQGNYAGGGDAVEHAVARVARGADRAVGTALFRRLRQSDQQRRLAQRQAARLLAEIGERSGADAFEIAAIGREAEIEREDFVLGEGALDLDRAHDLPQLRREAALGARFEQPRNLHGDGRGAGDDAAVADQLRQRAAERERIDAVMRAEALVLVGEQQVREIADRRSRASPAVASARPAWCRGAAVSRRGPRRGWRTQAPPPAAPARARRSSMRRLRWPRRLQGISS